MRTLLCTIVLVILVAVCNQKKTKANLTEPAASQASEPSQAGLASLCGDPNTYISNIAKHALASWKVKEYQSAAIEMQKLMELCRTETQSNSASSSLGQLKLKINQAAANGHANAKNASAQLRKPRIAMISIVNVNLAGDFALIGSPPEAIGGRCGNNSSGRW